MLQTWKCDYCAKSCTVTLNADEYSFPKFCTVFDIGACNWKKEEENGEKEQKDTGESRQGIS